MTKDKSYYNLLHRIADRAQALDIARGDTITQMMDIDHAADQFNMRLEEMAEADDFNFAHDFIGIQNTMNRETGMIEGLFVPRFAGHKAQEVCYE